MKVLSYILAPFVVAYRLLIKNRGANTPLVQTPADLVASNSDCVMVGKGNLFLASADHINPKVIAAFAAISGETQTRLITAHARSMQLATEKLLARYWQSEGLLVSRESFKMYQKYKTLVHQQVMEFKRRVAIDVFSGVRQPGIECTSVFFGALELSEAQRKTIFAAVLKEKAVQVVRRAKKGGRTADLSNILDEYVRRMEDSFRLWCM